MKNTLKQDQRERVVTFLNREEVDFLDKLGKDALFSNGLKLSRAKLLSWFVDFVKKLNINGENIKSGYDLENRILKIMGKLKEKQLYLPRKVY